MKNDEGDAQEKKEKKCDRKRMMHEVNNKNDHA
jgi:hypothetical protein